MKTGPLGDAQSSDAGPALDRYVIYRCVVGSQAYGLAREGSDVDRRGIYLPPAAREWSLYLVEQNDEIELDLVTHDIRKFFKFLLRPNGYVLEQLLSPILVHTTPEHEEVKALIPAAILTRHHAHHYLGFAGSQWRLFRKEEQPRIKPLLYTFRVLLTGVHLMRTGTIEANLGILHEMYSLPFVPDLMARKLEGAEQQTLAPGEVALYEQAFQSLRERLVAEAYLTALPESPDRTSSVERYSGPSSSRRQTLTS